MTTDKKDTIYIDVDDEITSIIEKVRSSPQKIVALVLPKRAAVLQSIVNMKLLKRSSDEVKKHLVLITSETALFPLAGAVGLYVAKTLLSKPVVPAPPPNPDADDEKSETVNEAEPTIDPAKPVGVLAGLSPPEEETIEVDNDEPEVPMKGKKEAKASKVPKGLRIPNFTKFRTKLLLAGAALILLLIGLYIANFVMPKANIVIKTDTETINASVKFVASPTIKEFDEEKAIVPSLIKELKKSEGQKAPATGQKNVGEKASGTVKLINCSQADKLSDTVRTVPAGTVVSSGSLNFVLSQPVDVEPSNFILGICQKNKKSSSVNVVAQNSGDTYNIAARDYTVGGYPSMTAQGSDMAGGTNKTVKVVSQGDIDGLKEQIIETFTASVKDELKQQFTAENLVPLLDTMQVGEPVVLSTPNANTEAQEVTVNVTMTFTMQGVNQENIVALIQKEISDDIDTARQTILDNGLTQAIFQIGERRPNNDVSYTLQTLVVAGPQIDQNALKQEITGKKRGEAQNIIQSRPGVKDVTVEYSPFWVAKAPKPAKISVTVESTTPTSDENADQ